MKEHEHTYIPAQIAEECSVCGLLKSTIESMSRKKCGCDGNDLDQFGKCPHDVRTSGEKFCILPTCKDLAGHDGYYCENHHTKYYLGKTECPMRGRMCQCSDKEKCIHQPIEELQPYAERSREDWIKWAESEIVEYQKFLNFLKKKI